MWNHILMDMDAMSNDHNSYLSAWYETGRMLFAIGYLYYKMKSAVFVGLIIGGLLIWLNKKIAIRLNKLYEEMTDIRHRKIKLITYLTSRIQELKMCRLETYMYSKMTKIREEEFRNLSYDKLL
jgi:hypothetical protein